MTRFLHVLIAIFATLLVLVSFLPSIETEWWGIRLLDFPRLQVAMALLALGLILFFLLRRAPRATGALLLGVAAALCAHALVLWPYKPGGASFVESCPAESRLRVMVSNVQLGNEATEPLLDVVRSAQPDLLLALETNQRWSDALRPLKESMPYGIEKITGSYYGLNLLSRLPLVDAQIRDLGGSGTPAVVMGVRLRDGTVADFIGLHPKPPLPWQSALRRDAELYAAALLMRERTPPAILAGDLNATPWEAAVLRMRRVAKLIDPRRGYGYVPTFSAKSWIMSWPLDHIFHKGGFSTVAIGRLPAIGSDHYPLLVELCHDAQGGAPQSERPDDMARVRSILDRAREAN